MNRQEAKQMLPIIQAYAEGKEIEFRSKGFDEEWKKVNEIPGLSYSSFDYRVKPKPQYRPFKDAEECWEEMQKHQPFGWVKAYHGQFVITEIRDSKAIIGRNNNFMDYDYMLENYTFADGTPFGIKE